MEDIKEATTIAEMGKAMELAKQFEQAAAAGRAGAFPETALLAALLMVAGKLDGLKESIKDVVDALALIGETPQAGYVYEDLRENIEDSEQQQSQQVDYDQIQLVSLDPADREYREDPPIEDSEPRPEDKPKRKYERKGFGA